MPVRQCSRRLWRSAAARVLACLCEGLPPMLGNRHLIFCHCRRQEIGKAPCVPVYIPDSKEVYFCLKICALHLYRELELIG